MRAPDVRVVINARREFAMRRSTDFGCLVADVMAEAEKFTRHCDGLDASADLQEAYRLLFVSLGTLDRAHGRETVSEPRLHGKPGYYYAIPARDLAKIDVGDCIPVEVRLLDVPEGVTVGAAA